MKDLSKSKKNWQEVRTGRHINSYISKAKQKYYSCKKAAELALITYDRAQSDPSMQTNKLSKVTRSSSIVAHCSTQLNTAQQQAKKEAEVAEAAYRMSIKEFNLTQAKYEEDMIKILMVRLSLICVKP